MKRIGLLPSCLLLPLAGLAAEVEVGEAIRFGSKVEISEAVQGPLAIAAGHVVVNAPVGGNVRLAGGRADVRGAGGGGGPPPGGKGSPWGAGSGNVPPAS